MVDALGGVTVNSPLAFTTEELDYKVEKGANRFNSEQALDFAVTRVFGTLGPEDFIRVGNHQALLLGLLIELHKRQNNKGFVESMALSAIDGIDTEDASPLDLYRLLNALTSVDASSAEGCILYGTEGVDPVGNQIIVPDPVLADRLASEAKDDATFETPCESPVPGG
jgi:hypothetical protein